MSGVEEAIKNEVRVIEKVREKRGHPNIITVLKHGWLREEQYHFDMELCILNLEDYILGNFKSVLGIGRYYNPGLSRDTLSCLSLWGILSHIARGLEFLHASKEMHRDLKPRNGTLLSPFFFTVSFP